MNGKMTVVVALFSAIMWHQSQLRGTLPVEPLREWDAPECADDLECLNLCYSAWDALPDATKGYAWCSIGTETGKAGTGPDGDVDPSVPLE